MLFKSVFVFASAISASVAASSDLCLQGCCGLSFKLPSTSLTLHHLTIDKSSVQVPLKNSEITCCPCDDTLTQPQAPLQAPLSVNNNTVCPDGLTCNNGTATPPTLPTQPKPKDPKNTKSAPKLTGNPCAEGQCWHDCDCGPGLTPADFAIPSTDDSKAQALQAESIPICPEGQCFSDCECSVDGLMAFINPGIPLASMPRVCASGECSTDCICRDDLVKTAQVVASLRKHHSSSKLKKGANQKVLAGKSEL